MKKILLTILFCVFGFTMLAQNNDKKANKSLQEANPIVVLDNKVLGKMNDPKVKKIMAALDPKKIENMSVLKDSTACIKLYGAEAKYGVIVIITKNK